MWLLWMVVLCPLTESFRERNAEKVIGTLGGSVTFRMKTSNQYPSISWHRINRASSGIVAVVTTGLPCSIKVVLSELAGRLSVPGDCKNLQISNLNQDDSGLYRSQILEDIAMFRLRVYKYLSDSDLEVQCENNTLSDGNYTLQLNCSAGKWKDGVNYSWTSQSKNGKTSSQVVQIQGDDMKYICTAENPVSKTSKTVSIKQACEGAMDFNVDPPSYVLIGATIAVLIVVKVIVCVLVVALAPRKETPQRRPSESASFSKTQFGSTSLVLS